MGKPGRGTLFLMVAAAILAIPTAAAAQVNLGFAVGLNSSGLSGDAPPDVSYTGRTGFLASVVADFRVADDVWISVQPGYAGRGTGLAFKVKGEEEPRDSLSLSADYLSVPVLMKVQAGRKVYVTGGLDVSYLLSAELAPKDGGEGVDFKEGLKDFSLGIVFGVGAMFPIGKPRITVEGRYVASLTNDAESERSDTVGTDLPARFRFTGLQLLVGVLFPLGGP